MDRESERETGVKKNKGKRKRNAIFINNLSVNSVTVDSDVTSIHAVTYSKGRLGMECRVQ